MKTQSFIISSILMKIFFYFLFTVLSATVAYIFVQLANHQLQLTDYTITQGDNLFVIGVLAYSFFIRKDDLYSDGCFLLSMLLFYNISKLYVQSTGKILPEYPIFFFIIRIYAFIPKIFLSK